MGGKGSGGSNRKPAIQKQRLGNPGHADKSVAKRAPVTKLPIKEIPEPHRPLGKAGLDLWGRVWLACSAWLDEKADGETVLLLCEAVDERQPLRYFVLTNPDAHTERRALRELDKQITSGLGQLGMNPLDRDRLNIPEAKVNEFAELNARIAARRAASAS